MSISPTFGWSGKTSSSSTIRHIIMDGATIAQNMPGNMILSSGHVAW
jgi:hypothetical protein